MLSPSYIACPRTSPSDASGVAREISLTVQPADVPGMIAAQPLSAIAPASLEENSNSVSNRLMDLSFAAAAAAGELTGSHWVRCVWWNGIQLLISMNYLEVFNERNCHVVSQTAL